MTQTETPGVPTALVGNQPTDAHSPQVPALVTVPLECGRVTNAAESPICQATIMIVDDEPLNIDLVSAYLAEAGYRNFRTTADSTQALDVMLADRPDVVLLDLMMPRISGFDILGAMQRDVRLRHTPVIILTASSDANAKMQALELGASDFLAKPVDPSELILRLRNTLAAKAYQDHLQNYSEELQKQVRLRTSELEASRQEIIHCLARAAEYRDDDTGYHVQRVGRYVGVIAEELGFAGPWLKLLEQAAQLHDVGKIGIPDSILLKPGKLDPSEYDFMRRHCDFGTRIIQPMEPEESEPVRQHTRLGGNILSIPSSPIMILAARIAETHHERWDGTGYPHGLSGEEIPIEGRITAVADVFDALCSERPYKRAFPLEKSLQIIREGRGTQFDAQVVDAFLARIEQIVGIQQELADKDVERPTWTSRESLPQPGPAKQPSAAASAQES